MKNARIIQKTSVGGISVVADVDGASVTYMLAPGSDTSAFPQAVRDECAAWWTAERTAAYAAAEKYAG